MENDELRQQVLDKMTKTCPCRVITRNLLEMVLTL